MNSLEIREAKLNLIDMINSIALPLEVKRMMLREVMVEMDSATEKEIQMLVGQREATEKAEATKNEKEGD